MLNTILIVLLSFAFLYIYVIFSFLIMTPQFIKNLYNQIVDMKNQSKLIIVPISITFGLLFGPAIYSYYMSKDIVDNHWAILAGVIVGFILHPINVYNHMTKNTSTFCID